VRRDGIADGRNLRAGKVMEQGGMRRDQVAVGREMQPAQPLEPRLVVRVQRQRQDERRVSHARHR